MRTPGFGLSRRNSTSGVLPIASTMSPYLPPQGLLSRRGSSTSESVVPSHSTKNVSSCEYGGAQQQTTMASARLWFTELPVGGPASSRISEPSFVTNGWAVSSRLLAHRSEATAVADAREVRPGLPPGVLRAVPGEAERLVEGVGTVVRGEGPRGRDGVPALPERLEHAVHQRPPHAAAPAARRDEEGADLADRLVHGVVAALSAGADAEQLAVFLHQDLRHGRILEELEPPPAVGLRERMPLRQQVGEAGAGRLVPDALPRRLVAPLGESDLQRPPPAIAGRITTVSPSDTPVPRPSSTRTSSSFR